MRTGRVVVAVTGLVVLAGAAFLIWARRPALPPIAPPQAAAFDAALVAKGARLAAIGDCAGCHASAGGRPYGGGVAIETPFGTIYGSNITPDPDAGIGRWSSQAFRRAMQDGVDREGRHLYPAFPYDHFTGLSDADVEALYAFFMTRAAVPGAPPQNRLVFPLNIRLTAAAWKLVFFRPGRWIPSSGESEEWNRGAYLAEALGHCGACHTPRGLLQAEDRTRHFAGGEQEGWIAPALDRSSPAPLHWSADGLFAYLRGGSDPRHGVAAGPMATVVRNLRPAADEDVRAIAVYVASVMGEPTPERRQRDDALAGLARDAAIEASPGEGSPSAAGAAIYAGACAGCHDAGSSRPYGGRPLSLQTAVALESPRNLIQIVLHGLSPAEGEAGPMMPGFADALTDRQTADVVAYVRSRFGHRGDTGDVEAEVRRIRGGG